MLSDKEFIFQQNYRLEDLIKWNLSHIFLKALASAQNLHCRTTIFAEHLPMTASAFTHDHDIIIIKGTESLKIFSYEEVAGRWIGTKIC